MAQMHSLESGFKKAKRASAERRKRRRLRLWFGWFAVGAMAVLIVGIALNFSLIQRMFAPAPEVPVVEEIADTPDVYIPAIVDLAGDPMRISIGENFGAQLTRSVPRPDGMPAERAGGEIAVLSDTMITQSQRFMTTLPSSPKDFAFYQSQRMRASTKVGDAEAELAAYDTEATLVDAFAEDAEPDFVLVDPDADPIEQPAPVTEAASLADDGDGWGGAAAAPGEEAVVQTAVADTTSVTEVYEEGLRYRPDGDIFVRVLVDRTLQSLITENGLSAADGELYGQAMAAVYTKDQLKVGDIVAVRAVRDGRDNPRRVVQLSIYTASTYIGTLARADDGQIVVGADPWVREDLFKLSGSEEVAQPGRQYRLLDAIYSTATRNGVPTGVVGEAIMLLSRSFDLAAFASNDDKLVLAYAPAREGDSGGLGRVLYVAVKGTGRDFECYVYRANAASDFSCFDPSTAAAPGLTPGGMVTPVNGVMTSKFGPRMHPIFHEMRVHTGVDWAAPSGTPIYAAYAGTVASAAVAGGYGNMVRLSHPGGKETRYAHMSRFADGLVAGRQVAAGELIGYVGTTGNSTGPHLHFEVRVADAPVDPLTTVVTVATVSTAVFVSDGSAVDRLTDKIVHVESGGNASAKNPLSSATGAGQFIKSTWLRMMRTYRPDLANSMSEADLLALRFDFDLSREMVKNLAREGEAYLKARGHEITAGRLYLCHFLGMDGAHQVLAAAREVPLDAVLPAGVLGANPFLKGKDVAYVQDWAERKMSGAAPKPSTSTTTTVAQPPVAPTASPEFALFKQAIAEILAPPNPDALLPEEPAPEGTPAEDGDNAMLAPERPRNPPIGAAV